EIRPGPSRRGRRGRCGRRGRGRTGLGRPSGRRGANVPRVAVSDVAMDTKRGSWRRWRVVRATVAVAAWVGRWVKGLYVTPPTAVRRRGRAGQPPAARVNWSYDYGTAAGRGRRRRRRPGGVPIRPPGTGIAPGTARHPRPAGPPVRAGRRRWRGFKIERRT